MGTFKARLVYFIFIVIIFSFSAVSSLWAAKKASIVICAETGKVYHEDNADVITHPASLTKMMTLYLTFKAIRDGKISFDQKMTVSKAATLPIPTKLWLKKDSIITVRQAILGLITKSANDASVVLAETLGRGSEDYFATLMTDQARRLGMANTVFKNSHGLPNKKQITTARDMAILSRALYKDFPEYFAMFKEEKFVFKGQTHANHNHLLGKVPGLDGIKTGFINASGFNLSASVVRNNHRIIAVVMGGESRHARDKKMVKLLEATYSNLTGKIGPTPKKGYNSINELLCDAALIETQTKPAVAKMQRAVYREQCPPKVQYTSMTDLLAANSISDNFPEDQEEVKKGSPKIKKKLKAKTKPKFRPKSKFKKKRRMV